MNRQLLETPFSPDQIKQRSGSFGKTLDYVEAHAVIQRLNDAFDGNWTFEIISHDILKETDEVLVLGKFIAGSIIKMQFGSSSITKAKNSGDIISLADDLKAAATDALKKCSTMLGVGLHLYSGQQPSTNANQSGSNHADQNTTGNNSANESKSGIGNGEKTRITNKQLNYIINLGKDIGLDSKSLDKETVEMYGVKLAYLTTKDASFYIDSLKKKAA